MICEQEKFKEGFESLNKLAYFVVWYSCIYVYIHIYIYIYMYIYIYIYIFAIKTLIRNAFWQRRRRYSLVASHRVTYIAPSN